MPLVYTYEVEVRVVHKLTGAARLVLRTESAYGVMDAVMQAILHVGIALGANEEVKLATRVGPPSDLVKVAEADVAQQIQLVMDGLKKKVPK